MPSQYVNLMPEDQDLGCQRRSRSEQPDQHRPDKAAGFLHRTERLRDSASVVSPIEFTTGTSASDAWRVAQDRHRNRAERVWPSTWSGDETRRLKTGGHSFAITRMGSLRWICLSCRQSRFACSMDC